MSFRRAVMLALALVATTAMAQEGTSTGAAAPAAKAPPTAADMLSGDVQAGQAKAATCAACHGMDGNSSDPQYPKLAGQSEPYIVQQLQNFKSGKRQNAIMANFVAQLSDKDMHDIGAYFASKKVMPGVADPALAKIGEKLYREGDTSRDVPACMACHGPDGRGNPGALYPQLAGQHADYVQRTLTAWHDGTTWGKDAHAMIMPAIAKRLSAKDIAAVSSYIQGLHTVAP